MRGLTLRGWRVAQGVRSNTGLRAWVCGVRQEACWSRSDGTELLVGDAVVHGLDGGPGVPDGSWRVVLLAVKGFDDFLGRGNQVVKDQVDAGVPVKLFLFLALGHEAWAAAGSEYEASTGRERCDNCRVNVIRAAS